MDLSRKAIDELYFNNPDMLVVTDCTVLQIEEVNSPATFGIVFQLSHMETGIEYRQMFLLSELITKDLTMLLEEHLKHEHDDGCSL